MKYEKEIQSAVTNLKYYNDKVEELAKKQLGNDVDTGIKTGVNNDLAHIRYAVLGDIQGCCFAINHHIDGVIKDIRIAKEVEVTQYESEHQESIT